jgi:hypothetical protein
MWLLLPTFHLRQQLLCYRISAAIAADAELRQRSELQQRQQLRTRQALRNCQRP